MKKTYESPAILAVVLCPESQIMVGLSDSTRGGHRALSSEQRTPAPNDWDNIWE